MCAAQYRDAEEESRKPLLSRRVDDPVLEARLPSNSRSDVLIACFLPTKGRRSRKRKVDIEKKINMPVTLKQCRSNFANTCLHPLLLASLTGSKPILEEEKRDSTMEIERNEGEEKRRGEKERTSRDTRLGHLAIYLHSLSAEGADGEIV